VDRKAFSGAEALAFSKFLATRGTPMLANRFFPIVGLDSRFH